MSKQYFGIMLLMFCSLARAQEQTPSDQPHDMSGMPAMSQTEQGKDTPRNTSDKDVPEQEKDTQEKDAQDKDADKAATMPAAHETPGAVAGSATAIHSMEGHHVDMGPHMKMTSLRKMKPDDQEKAASVLQTARAVAAKYQDYKDALAEGYKIFLPNLPQKQYHFTNYWYGYEAGVRFNPAHPTSLLYEKHGDDYKLVGLMYTAPKHASEEELDSRIPLSIAQWHAHINLCLSPQDKKPQTMSGHPKFGLGGSITTKEACDAAGGRFMPQIFGWMVHVYPLEQKPEEIWSVERQAHSHMD